MYDELIARIRYHIRKADFMGLKEYESTRLLNEAADAIEELQGELQALKDETDMAIVEDGKETRLCFVKKWIPVTERLPEEYEYVLCRTDYGMEVGYHRDEWGQDEWTTGKFGDGTIDVSHWMPLPQPPESE